MLRHKRVTSFVGNRKGRFLSYEQRGAFREFSAGVGNGGTERLRDT